VPLSIAFFAPHDLKWGGRKRDQPALAKEQGQIACKPVIFEK
jgi:hypothetical protein